MNLRPHHLLCIQKFTGHGYDAAFTAHMTRVVEMLRHSPETQVTLATGCDDLCVQCPHRQGSACDTPDKVTRMDRAVAEACGLAPGDTAAWQDLSRKAREAVFATDAFQRICASCAWFDLCKRTEVRYVRGE